ncbi:hypothetical protein L7F22_005842 [Adiantum nelumboides]|nr:hypothetical protein [Adiantum nelumboides]
MHFQKSARQWWASLRANGEAPKTWKALRASIMKQFLASDAKDKVLTKWRNLKLSPYESIHKYVDKFLDLHLKATVYKKIDFEEQKQQFCAGIPKDMNEYVNSQRPRSISMVIHHTMVAARINFQQGAKRNLKPMEAKEKQEYKGKNFSQNSSKGNSNNNKAKEKGVFKGKNKLTPEELKRYRKENKCFKCGEQGHSYRSCPQRNPRNEQHRASMVEAPKEEDSWLETAELVSFRFRTGLARDSISGQDWLVSVHWTGYWLSIVISGLRFWTGWETFWSLVQLSFLVSGFGLFEDSVVRFDLTSGRIHPLGKKFIIDNRSDTTIHSAPLKYCHTCKKDTDVGENPPYLDILPEMDESDNVDWVHLAATIDTWGNRGTTWVTPEGNQIPQCVPLKMIRAVSAHLENTRTEILTDEETSSIFEGCDSRESMVESTIETSLNSKLDEEVNIGSSSTPSDNLTSTEEDPSEDHSTDFALGTTHNYKSDKKRKKYKRRRYRANVRAKMNKKQSTADWLCYLGALDAHRKLVDNWGEHLQSVMWCSPQPHDIAQLEIAEKPKLNRTTRRRQNRKLSQQQKGIEDKAQSTIQKKAIDIHPANMATSNASSSISIEKRYPFSLSQLCRLCYPVISLEWDHIEQLAREKNLDELEWLIRLLTTSDPYSIEDMHPIAQIYPLAQVDYTLSKVPSTPM